jgi:GNAT superfamily N-acetyltransferase
MTARLLIAVMSVVVVVGGCKANAARDKDAKRTAVPPAAPGTLDGTIAFNTRGGDIWLMNADGSGRRRLTRSGPGTDFDPDLSPDGRQVVFRTSRGHHAPDPNGIGLEGIFVVDAHTRRERQIQPRTGGLFPAWSPTGSKIAFSGVQGRGETLDTIHLMNPDGSGVVDLGPPGECATWSPDGSKLAFCSHQGDGNWAIWVMDADGKNRKQLTHPKLIEPAGAHGDYPGAWSQDGDQIVYTSDADGDRELFLMNADGSNQHRLTHFKGADAANAWLPDGRIVFAHFQGDELASALVSHARRRQRSSGASATSGSRRSDQLAPVGSNAGCRRKPFIHCEESLEIAAFFISCHWTSGDLAGHPPCGDYRPQSAISGDSPVPDELGMERGRRSFRSSLAIKYADLQGC